MELINLTGEKLSGVYDSNQFLFPPGEVVEVSDGAGAHLLSRIPGLLEARDEDVDKLRLEALGRRVMAHRATLQAHHKLQLEQEERKAPAIIDSDAVRIARRMLPLYEKVVGEITEKFGAQEEAQALLDAEAALQKTPQLKAPEDSMDLGQLRARAAELGVEETGVYNKSMLRKIIKEFERANAAEAEEMGR